MAVTSHVPTKFAKAIADKLVNLETDTLKVMLLSAYTPSVDSHEFVSDFLGAGTESVGTGYSAGGQTLASVTYTLTGHTYVLSCTNPAWTATGGSLAAAYAVFFDSTPGSNATNPVFCYWDLGGTQTSTATFTLSINAGGLFIAAGTG